MIRPQILVLALLLAGCADSQDTQSTPAVITDPTDYTYNDTEAHVHDYWGSQRELMVVDEIIPDSFVLNTPYNDIRFWPSGLVPQGAASLNITATVTRGLYDVWDRATVLYQSAADAEPIEIGPVGDTIELISNNTMNDLPHQQMSAWQFFIRIYASDNWMTADLEAELVVTAHRGIEIPLYPGHPDRWHNATSLPLFEEGTGTFIEVRPAGVHFRLFGSFEEHVPEVVVPYDASHVVVNVTTRTSSDVARVGLMYHGADSRDMIQVAPDNVQNGVATYTIDVDGRGDGAYAKQSLWVFATMVEEPAENMAFVGGYHIEATVFK